jgi:twitching motility protein PilT
VYTASDVISLSMTLMPDRRDEVRQTGATTEWTCDMEGIGRVRCTSVDDPRSPAAVFRIMAVRPISVDQLGLPREIQSLAMEPEGLVLVAGPRSSGTRTLMSGLVDLINRTRRGHVITLEREVNFVYAQGHSVISQREVRGNDDDMLAAARAALREDPDVLLLDQIRTASLMTVALDAAASGRLVIGGFSAHNATESIDRIINLYKREDTQQAQLALADHLRGVVAQVLLAKTGGGRVAAREVLLNTASVANAIAEGKTSQLPMAIEGGRRYGMVLLNDALIAYVRTGVVDVVEAYRHVTDRPAFVALLKRHGIDTSAIDRSEQTATTNARPAH